MPLTPFQTKVALLLAENRTEDSHLAGGAALHLNPESIRFSEDLDYFHDFEARVGSAFRADKQLLEAHGYKCSIEMNQPGYIRCLISKGKLTTKVEWAHDSAWRFMPVQKKGGVGYSLHDIDLAINKVLALAGRDEARDYLDVLHVHDTILPLGALCWAACGKDPGLNPSSLLELLKRRGKYRPEDFSRLKLTQPVDLQELKKKWLSTLERAETFVKNFSHLEVGCLFYSKSKGKFVEPTDSKLGSDISPHFGKEGGVIPTVVG